MMRKRILPLLLALTLAMGLAPAALAAARPTLYCQVRLDDEEIRLTLEDLEGEDIYAVQLELTLEGDYAGCTFSPDSDTAYAPDCGVETARNRTYVTIYLTDRAPINDGESLVLGTLAVEGITEDAMPKTAEVILLDENLRPNSDSGRVSTDISVRGESNPDPKPNPKPTPPTPSQPDTPEPTPPTLPDIPTVPPFADVKAGDWFYDAVGYVYGKGMMNGVDGSSFQPYAAIDRAMIVTILHRLEGSPSALPASFTDVAAGAYYAGPVAWASANGVVNGYEDGTFRPATAITREQLAAILYRYAQYRGLAGPNSPMGNPSQFPDASSVSSYAADAMSWAIGTGLLTGIDGKLQPQGTANRAQAAVILQRFCVGLMGLS